MKKDKVLCLIETKEIIGLDEEQLAWIDLGIQYNFSTFTETVIPLYDHFHNDIENGQKEKHYHINSKYNFNTNIGFNFRITLPLKSNQKLEYRWLYKISEEERFKTPVSFINKSKFKHNCIHKGKCPHRGFDLSNESPDSNGAITCPLHGLKFNSKTKLII